MTIPSATVRVRIVVEVRASGTWGPDCTLGQIHDQALESAGAILGRALGAAPVRIIETIATDVIVHHGEPR